jgi:NADP-dependent aldehyde dehydrogenase
VQRFLRPVCYQDFPERLLPQSLRDENPDFLWRQRDGIIGRH